MIDMIPKGRFSRFSGFGRFFNVGEKAEVHSLLAIPNLGMPFGKFLVPRHPKNARSVTSRHATVPHIPRRINDTEIGNSVVRRHVINVVNLARRPFAIVNGPCDAVCDNFPAENAAFQITPIIRRARFLPRIAAVPARGDSFRAAASRLEHTCGPRFPNKETRRGVVIQKLTKNFGRGKCAFSHCDATSSLWSEPRGVTSTVAARLLSEPSTNPKKCNVDRGRCV